MKKKILYANLIDKEILDKFKELAKRDDRTQKSLMNKIIKEYVEANY